MSSIGTQLYNDSASLGKFTSGAQMVFMTLLGTALIIIGGYLISRKNKYTKSAKAIVQTATCTPDYQNNPVTQSCNMTISYTVGGKKYSGVSVTTEGEDVYTVGETVTVQYDPSNPEDATLSPFPMHLVGIGLIVMALLFIGASIYSFYIATHYQTAAAAMGAGTAIGTFLRLV